MKRVFTTTLLSLLLLGSVHGQFYDWRAEAFAEEYLKDVERTLGEEKLAEVPFNYLIQVGRTIGQLDKAILTHEAFFEHVKQAVEVKGRYYPADEEDLFVQYILPLRIRTEHSTPDSWRKTIRDRLEKELNLTNHAAEDAAMVFDWLGRHVKLIAPYDTYRLNLKGDLDPVSTLRSGHGTEIDVAILAVAGLRSLGIASRIVYAPSLRQTAGGKVWVEFFDEEFQWTPWIPSGPKDQDHRRYFIQEFQGKIGVVVANPENPENITPEYLNVPAAHVHVAPEPLQLPNFQYTLMLPEAQGLSPVMGVDIYTVLPRNMEKGVGPGEYYISAGARSYYATLAKVHLDPGETAWYVANMFQGKDDLTKSNRRPPQFPFQPEQPVAADTE